MSYGREERLRTLHDCYVAKVNLAISRGREEDVDELVEEYSREAAHIAATPTVLNAATAPGAG